MPTTDLRARNWDIVTHPENGARLRLDWTASPLAGRTFEVTVTGLDDAIDPTIVGDLMTIVIPTDDLTGRPRWTLWETTSGTPRKKITGRVLLSSSGTQSQDDSTIVVVEDEVEVPITVLGDPGPAGLSAYEIAVDNGFAGTEADWLSSLIGPEGPEGPEGASGATDLAYTAAPTQGAVTSSTGADAVIPAADSTNAGLMLPAQVVALDATVAGLADETTARADADSTLADDLTTESAARAAGDAAAVQRANHTGTQLAATISDLSTAIAAVVIKSYVDALNIDAATLDGETVASLTTAITAAIIDTAPGTLDTLNELAAAIGDDPNFATTITNLIAGKQPLDSDLTAIAALTTTAFGRSFLDRADAAAARTLLALGTAAVAATGDFDAAGAATAAQAAAVQRANHTGTQAISTVTGLQTALDSEATTRAAADTAAATAVAVDTALARWRNRRRNNYDRDNLPAFHRFVDSVSGSDSNDGLTPQTPWASLSKVNLMTSTLTAGMRVGLKRGSTFRETFTVHASSGPGTVTDPITFGAYGVGKPPVIKGSTQLSVTWTLDSGSVYQATTAINPTAAIFIDDDTVLIKAASRGAMTAGSFFSNGTTMYIWLTDGTSPSGHVVEYNVRGSTISCGVAHVHFQDIAWKHGGSNAAILFNATASLSAGMQVRRCDVGPNLGVALLMGVAGGLVEDNYFHDCWTGVDYPSGSGDTPSFTTNTDGTICRYNVIVNNYKGIRGLNTHANLLIHNNIVVHPRVNGIDITGGTAGKPSRIYNNVVWHRTTTGNGHGIDLQTGTASSGIIVKNNIVYCDDTTVSPANLELYTIDSTGYVGVDWNNNIGYRTPGCTAAYGKIGASVYTTFAAWKTAFQAAYGSTMETASQEADPLLSSVTWPGGKFVPTPGSPALNAGTVIGGVTDDYLGLGDYAGTGVDIGAYEVS